MLGSPKVLESWTGGHTLQGLTAPPAELPCGCAACYHIILLSLFSECLGRVYSAVCMICYAKFTSYRILLLFLVAMTACRHSWIVLPVQYALLFLLSEP